MDNANADADGMSRLYDDGSQQADALNAAARSQSPEEAEGDEDQDSIHDEAKEMIHDHVQGVRYRMEIRDRLLGDLRERKEIHEAEAEYSSGGPDEPPFEIIATIYTRELEVSPPKKQSGPVKARENLAAQKQTKAVSSLLEKPRYHMNIYSTAIINALQSVVRYYPDQKLIGDPVRVSWPYHCLVHHFDELTAFRDAARSKEHPCEAEKNTVEHLTSLLEFLDTKIMPQVRREQERNKKGFYSWEFLWVAFKPGLTWIRTPPGQKHLQARVICRVRGGTFVQHARHPFWNVQTWAIDFDGQSIGRESTEEEFYRFDAERRLDGYLLDTDQFLPDSVDRLPSEIGQLIDHGRLFLTMLEKQSRYAKGNSLDHPFTPVESLAMVDLNEFYADTKNRPKVQLATDDTRKEVADGSCANCKRSRRGRVSPTKTGSAIEGGLYEDYVQVSVQALLQRKHAHHAHICLLLPAKMHAFIFKTRRWEPIHVSNLQEPRHDENMIEDLVMDPDRKDILVSLASSFSRKDKAVNPIADRFWSADFVQGKGSGLIFLLHGHPGVGKTCTAECIAAYIGRPLMILTLSDVGNTPQVVDENLTKMFRRAASWDAVLLIDEADVFMERRSSSDLERNSLVAAFLRALENYNGILFLTTNRVGAFDDAFISRVHVKLHYPEFSAEERKAVWETFVNKLNRERGESIRLDATAEEYVESKAIQDLAWNGREIKNAFQTAVALAEYHGKKDKNGKVLVERRHFKSVVTLSEDFKKYLTELHVGSESKRAQDRYER